jgi:hypothetical protein
MKRRAWRRWIPFVFLAVGLATVSRARIATPIERGRLAFVVRSAGNLWRVVARILAGSDERRSLPVVLIVHGWGGAVRYASTEPGWADRARTGGFPAVAPEGLPTTRFPAGRVVHGTIRTIESIRNVQGRLSGWIWNSSIVS